MAYNKVYNRTYWNNDKAPAINATNLNNIESGIDDIDSRVVEIGNDVSDVKSGLLTLIDGEHGSFQLINDIQVGKAWNNDNNTSRAVLYASVKPNTKYTISFGSLSSLGSTTLYTVEKVNKTDTSVIKATNVTVNPTTITTSATTKYIGIQLTKDNITLADVKACKIQLEEGENATPYTEYIPSVAQINNSLNALAYGEVGGKNLATINNNISKVNGNVYVDVKLAKPIKANTPYTVSWKSNDKSGTARVYPKNTSGGDTNYSTINANADRVSTITSTVDIGYIGIYVSNTSEVVSDFMVEIGSSATSYEPYIGQSVKSLNDSLNDYGMTNKFDGIAQNGYWSNGSIVSSVSDVCNTNPMSCNGGDVVSVKCNSIKRQIGIGFLDSSKAQISITGSSKNNTNEFSKTAPSNAKYVVFYISKNANSDTVEATIGDTRVYIGNAIESLKADLSGIKHFSFGGSSFTTTINGEIPDGTYLAVITEASSLTAVLSSPVVSFMVIQGGNLYNTFISNGDRVSGIAYSNGTLTITMKAGSYVVAKLIQM